MQEKAGLGDGNASYRVNILSRVLAAAQGTRTHYHYQPSAVLSTSANSPDTRVFSTSELLNR